MKTLLIIIVLAFAGLNCQGQTVSDLLDDILKQQIEMFKDIQLMDKIQNQNAHYQVIEFKRLELRVDSLEKRVKELEYLRPVKFNEKHIDEVHPVMNWDSIVDPMLYPFDRNF